MLLFLQPLVLNTHAESLAVHASCQSLEEYRAFVKTGELPEVFVYYENISFLGSFSLLTSYHPQLNYYIYHLIRKDEFKISLMVRPETNIVGDETTPEKDLRFNSHKGLYSYCNVGGICYRYIRGELDAVYWYDEEKSMEYTLSLDAPWKEYPIAEDRFFRQLLDLETAENAGRKLLRATGIQSEDSSLELNASQSWLQAAIITAATAIVAMITAIVTVLLLRKRKAKRLAGAGNAPEAPAEGLDLPGPEDG